MPIHRRYFPSSVSRYLPPGETGFADVVYQKGNLVLDAELLLNQDLRDLDRVRTLARQSPSGFIRGVSQLDSYRDFRYEPPWLAGPVVNPAFVANAFWMRKVQALVAGMVLDVEYTATDTSGDNLIQLSRPPLYDGTPPSIKRTDFVFLEVWLALLEPSAKAKGTFVVSSTITPNVGDTIAVNGVTLTGVLIVPAPNQFRIFPGNPASTAASIANQLNTAVPAVTCVAVGSIVQITAVTPGAAGNAITLSSSNGAAITPSGLTLTGGTDTSNKPTQDSIFRNGNVQSSSTVALPDDMEDPLVGVETAARVQIQYRIRTTASTEGINFKSQADGFSNGNVLGQGSQISPVVGYPFVPADLKTVLLNSDARDQAAGSGIGYGIEDAGLYIAGNGTSAAAAALGTLDGYVYAIPIAFVFRRNEAPAGWNPQTNSNGGLLHDHAPFANTNLFAVTGLGESDRPDGYFADAIVDTDVLDLRRHVRLVGHDLGAESQFQLQSLMDGSYRTWAIDTASKQMLGNGSGDVSTRNLICNEVGRTAAKGGVAPLSGDTTRGETIRNFDHMARRFGDQPVIERVVWEIRPSDIDPSTGKYVVRPGYAVGFAGWAEEDTIHMDLLVLNATTLGNFNPADATIPGPAPTGTCLDYAPAGTLITDVLSVYHDDGNFNVAVDQRVQVKSIVGLGTPHVEIVLDVNATQVNGGLPVADHDMVGTSISGDVGSPRRIFVELEVTYPLGVGLTDTPDLQITPSTTPLPYGPMVENWVVSGVDQRPQDMETRLAPLFRHGFREVRVEYITNDPSGGGGNAGVPIGTLTPEEVVSRDPLNIVLGRRFFGDGTKTVEVVDQFDSNPRDVLDTATHYGASTRLVVLRNTGIAPAVPLSGAGQTLVAVRFFGQDAVPNYGPPGGGYQQSIYFRTNAPQTVGVKEGVLPSGGFTNFPYIGAPGPMPSPLLVEPLYVAPVVYTGQVGMGSTELPYPYFAPLDQLPINDGRTEVPPSGLPAFLGEHVFAASANISIADFDAQVGSLALTQLVPLDKSSEWTIGGILTSETPFQDAEFRAVYPMVNPGGYQPAAMAQPLSNVTRHKVWVPILARSLQDCVLFRKGEMLLLVMVRWARLDANNGVEFVDTDSSTGVAIYRTRNLLLCAGD